MSKKTTTGCKRECEQEESLRLRIPPPQDGKEEDRSLRLRIPPQDGKETKEDASLCLRKSP